MKKHYYFLITLLIVAVGFAKSQTCLADYTFSTAPNSLTVNFTDQSTYPAGATHFWDFNDAASFSSMVNPTHTFSQAGTYIVYLSVSFNQGACFDSTSYYVTVPGTPPSCSASFTVAKDSSTSFGVLVTNTSNTANPNSTSYTWNFGDGNGGSGPTPTHTYQNFGSYVVCLTVNDSLANCTSTFCDTLGMDSLGNLKANGFSLTVVLPLATALEEVKLNDRINVFPNPVTDELQLEIGIIDEDLELTLLDLSGKTLQKFQLGTGRRSIDLSELKDGLYLLQFNTGNETVVKKILKQ